ncbi:hypothetical protein [Asticcacaulis taihuensis]|uniref:hypothetical protein n=1 Tax=Asticcacaulis taihuensis TaxID=260084 RepID=UPI0026EB0ABB|nr:hypothetical protein [Asticcacaulis taihuensis]
MKTTLQYTATILIPSIFLLYLGYIVLNGATDRHILDVLNGTPLLLMLISWIMPKQQGFWFWLGRVPMLFMLACAGWFYFRLAPPDERHSAWIGIGVWASVLGGAWLIDLIYKKWWPRLPLALKVALATTGVIVTTVAVLYLLSDMLRDTDWHDVLITNWYVTLLVLYLPVFLGVLLVRHVLENRKTERKS